MAEQELAVDGGGGKKKLLIIIIAAVLLLGGGGAAAFFLLSGDSSEEVAGSDAESAPEAVEEAVEATVGDAFYVGMPRPFVFNVTGHGRDRLVQIKVKLLVRGAGNDTAAKKHIPLIEDTLLTVFSASSAEMMATQKGKEQLREQALENVRNALQPIVGNPVVDKVLFTGFVMQ